MTDQTVRKPFGATLAWLFFIALLVLFAVQVAHVLVLVFLAVLIGTYLSAITEVVMAGLRAPRWVGLLLAVTATLAALAAIVGLLLPPVIAQTQDLLTSLPDTVNAIQAVLAEWAARYPWLSSTQLADPQSGVLPEMLESATRFVRISLLPYAWAGGELLIEGTAMIVMALYLARSPGLYRDGIVAVVPPRYRDVARRVIQDAGETLRAWVVGQLLAMTVLAILTAIGLWMLRVEYWLTFGLFTGLVAIVPFFGTLVSTILPALFVVGTGSWLHVFAVLALGVVVHLVEANLVVPRIMERQIALPPVLTIASVLLMGTLLGPVGLVVAVPVLAVTLVLGRHILIGEIYGDHPGAPLAVLRPVEESPVVEAQPSGEPSPGAMGPAPSPAPPALPI